MREWKSVHEAFPRLTLAGEGHIFPAYRYFLNRTMKKLTLTLAITTALVAGRGFAQDPDFAKDIAPILEASCVKCHCEAKAKGKLRMDTKELAMKGGKNSKLIVPGKPDESSMIKSLLLPADDEDAMPPEGKAPRPDAAKIELLKKWIAAGAVWPDGVALKAPAEDKK